MDRKYIGFAVPPLAASIIVGYINAPAKTIPKYSFTLNLRDTETASKNGKK